MDYKLKIIHAIFAEDKEVISELVADKNVLEERWILGQTPLHVAVSLGNIELTQALLNAGANIEAQNKYGLTPLYIAIVHRDKAIVSLLLEAGASSETPCLTGETPYDISRNTLPEISELLANAHAKVVEKLKAMLNADRVAIAGVDESVRPEQLTELSRKYPFVEWSVLYKSESKPLYRFPSVEWIRELVEQSKQFQAETGQLMNLSIHLCADAVAGLVRGDFTPLKPIEDLLPYFQRMQLNVIYDRFTQFLTLLPGNIRQLPCNPQIILQLNGQPETEAIAEMLRVAGINHAYLHDCSGGRGRENSLWLSPVGSYTGYAGGLNLENLEKHLSEIARITKGHPIYIDLESGVRDNDNLFVLDRAEEVLKITKEWIK